jgi:hypothetical protein
MKLNRYSPQRLTFHLASILRKTIKYRNSKDDIMQITQSLMKKVEQKGELSIAELTRVVCSFIPESCDDCTWLSNKDKSSCPDSTGAPCRKYLNEVFDYLENRGLI